MSRAAREVGSWPLWRLSYDVREQLARLHGLEIPRDLGIKVRDWLRSDR